MSKNIKYLQFQKSTEDFEVPAEFGISVAGVLDEHFKSEDGVVAVDAKRYGFFLRCYSSYFKPLDVNSLNKKEMVHILDVENLSTSGSVKELRKRVKGLFGFEQAEETEVETEVETDAELEEEIELEEESEETDAISGEQ